MDKKKKKNAPIEPNPDKVLFGMPLPEAARRSDPKWAIPSPIRKSVEWLNKYGLNEEGLYRIPGNATKYQHYKTLFDSGEKSPENVAMVLSQYLRSLPEPLATSQFEAHVKVAISNITNPEERAAVLGVIMLKMPFAHRECLRYLSNHFRLVSNNAEKNKMPLKNLEISLGSSMGGALMSLLVEGSVTVPSTIVYGVSLSEAALHSMVDLKPVLVPHPIAVCTEWIKEKDDLFIAPAKYDFIQEWINKMNGGPCTLTSDVEPDGVAGLIKHFVVQLTDGLIPPDMMSRWQVLSTLSSRRRPKLLFELFPLLPEVNKATLLALLPVLRTTATKSTLLDSAGLSAIFGEQYRVVLATMIDHLSYLEDPSTQPVTEEEYDAVFTSKQKKPSSKRKNNKTKTMDQGFKEIAIKKRGEKRRSLSLDTGTNQAEELTTPKKKKKLETPSRSDRKKSSKHEDSVRRNHSDVKPKKKNHERDPETPTRRTKRDLPLEGYEEDLEAKTEDTPKRKKKEDGDSSKKKKRDAEATDSPQEVEDVADPEEPKQRKKKHKEDKQDDNAVSPVDDKVDELLEDQPEPVDHSDDKSDDKTEEDKSSEDKSEEDKTEEDESHSTDSTAELTDDEGANNNADITKISESESSSSEAPESSKQKAKPVQIEPEEEDSGSTAEDEPIASKEPVPEPESTSTEPSDDDVKHVEPDADKDQDTSSTEEETSSTMSEETP